MKPFVAFMAAVALVASVGACGETTTPERVVQPPVVPAAPAVASMYAVSSLSMLGAMGSPVGQEPRVKVYNDRGNGMAGVRVAFEVTAGGGSLGRTEAVTGEDGTAGVDFWKLGNDGVVNKLVARVGNFSATFTAYGLNPDEAPLARYDLVAVNGRPVPYTSGWNDLDAITELRGTLELYSQVFVRTFTYKWVYGDSTTLRDYSGGTYVSSGDGFRLEELSVDAFQRGDSLFVGPLKLPDEFVAPSLYLKQKQ